MKHISIAKDFSIYPAGRVVGDGPNSGERFREECLVPVLKQALETGEMVAIDIDGTAMLGSSFIDEAFGGLVRLHSYDAEKLASLIRIDGKEPLAEFYKKEILSCIQGE